MAAIVWRRFCLFVVFVGAKNGGTTKVCDATADIVFVIVFVAVYFVLGWGGDFC